MPIRLCCATMAIVLAASAGVAVAQTPPTSGADDSITHAPPPARPSSQLQLTPEQKVAILAAVRRDSVKASPINFVASVGAPVPPSIELYMLPDGIIAQVPETKVVKYTMVQEQLVLVDPTTMRVVEVIKP